MSQQIKKKYPDLTTRRSQNELGHGGSVSERGPRFSSRKRTSKGKSSRTSSISQEHDRSVSRTASRTASETSGEVGLKNEKFDRDLAAILKEKRRLRRERDAERKQNDELRAILATMRNNDEKNRGTEPAKARRSSGESSRSATSGKSSSTSKDKWRVIPPSLDRGRTPPQEVVLSQTPTPQPATSSRSKVSYAAALAKPYIPDQSNFLKPSAAQSPASRQTRFSYSRSSSTSDKSSGHTTYLPKSATSNRNVPPEETRKAINTPKRNAAKTDGSSQNSRFSTLSEDHLRNALLANDEEKVLTLLSENFNSVAHGEYEWLSELSDLGYHKDEIAELLISNIRDSPWISFYPSSLPEHIVSLGYHHPDCVHSLGRKPRFSLLVSRSSSLEPGNEGVLDISEQNDSIRVIEELCGVAGVIRNDRGINNLIGQVEFDHSFDELGATVTYDLNSDAVTDDLSSQGFEQVSERYVEEVELFLRISDSLQNMMSALGLAQKTRICCDSFTILRMTQRQTEPVIELSRISFTLVVDFSEALKSLKLDWGSEEWAPQDHNHWIIAVTKAESICELFIGDTKELFSERWPSEQSRALHIFSLALQLLHLGLSSYSHAHVDAFRPFFLDSPLRNICLLGADEGHTNPHIRVSLREFTCLNDMLQKPVMVFEFCENHGKMKTQARYDLLACAEDLMDLWGPGNFIVDQTIKNDQNLSALVIGGGSIKPSGSSKNTLHWSKNLSPYHNSPLRFSPFDKMIIGAEITINTSCPMSLEKRWPSFMESLENLGTFSDYWAWAEFQAGVSVNAAAPLVASVEIAANKSWTWHDGTSWKKRYLRSLDAEMLISELERPFGLQVSCCTGVARRVPLRFLLSEVMPIFAKDLPLSSEWKTLEACGIIQAFARGNLKNWIDRLDSKTPENPGSLKVLVHRIVRWVLLILGQTGVDPTGHEFILAFPEDHTPGASMNMALKIPCQKANLWTKILADTEDCATFACVTFMCLETKEHKCHGTKPWHCPSLETAVFRHKTKDELPTPPTISWDLQDRRLYWIGKPESGLQARVQKSSSSARIPRLFISVSRMPENWHARLAVMRPKREHIREKQISTWKAADVLVLAEPKS